MTRHGDNAYAPLSRILHQRSRVFGDAARFHALSGAARVHQRQHQRMFDALRIVCLRSLARMASQNVSRAFMRGVRCGGARHRVPAG